MPISNLIIPSILKKIRALNLYSEDDVDMMRNSLQAILWETEKMIILFIIFTLMGQYDYFLVTLAVLVSIRVNAGGYHSGTALNCLIFTFIMFYLSIIILPQFPLNTIGIWLISVFSLFATLLAAPVKSSERKDIIKTKDSTSKILSLVITLFWLTLVYIFQDHSYTDSVLWIIFLQNVQLLFEYFRRR